MPPIVYRIWDLLCQLLKDVPVGTNLGLLHLLFALLSGRFLPARGAVFAALADLGLSEGAVRRANNALAYGRWNLADLLQGWQQVIGQEGHFVPNVYEGVCPVACDLTGFFRPQLRALRSKHDLAQAGKALPAIVLGLAASVGRVGQQRLALPRLVVHAHPADTSEAALQARLIEQAAKTLTQAEALIVDAGFKLAALLEANVAFVGRLPKNFIARRNHLPAYKGKGRPAQYGEVVRPLARERAGNPIAATKPDRTARWKEGRYRLRALIFCDLVLSEAVPGSKNFAVVVIFDPRYKEPWLLASNLSVSAYALWRLYKDRWPIEQLPLAAKPMLGCGRAFVFSQDSRQRLPELALLAGNILSYIAASSPPVASGFWDRCARPTCGRLRRGLARVHFWELPVPEGQLRKKNSPTAHLPKGVQGHRRTKAVSKPFAVAKAA